MMFPLLLGDDGAVYCWEINGIYTPYSYHTANTITTTTTTTTTKQTAPNTQPPLSQMTFWAWVRAVISSLKRRGQHLGKCMCVLL
jgi:hypothetical protein